MTSDDGYDNDFVRDLKMRGYLSFATRSRHAIISLPTNDTRPPAWSSWSWEKFSTGLRARTIARLRA